MTRYARSGNTQKHQRMPGDATSWQEMKTLPEKVNKIRKEGVQEKEIKKRNCTETSHPDTSQKPDTLTKANSIEAKEENQSPTKNDVNENSKIRNAEENKSLTVASSVNLDNVDTSGLSRAQLKRLKKKRRIQEILAEQGIEIRGDKPYNQKKGNNSKEISDQLNKGPVPNSHETEISENSSEKKPSKKKNQYLERLKKRRMDNGILLLPSKVERKLYNMKRKFREDGVPPQAIREIIRKERRTEENQFRKTFTTKPCFNCRQTGHLLSDCPLTIGNSNQDTGICFKCGSTEHVSYRCPNKKIEGFPLATCFVCKKMGHVSKDCPKNEHGVYLNGGKCFLCGNINHYRSDCPSLKKKKKEIEMTAHTINEVSSSIDAEITAENIVTPEHTEKKKSRIVKF